MYNIILLLALVIGDPGKNVVEVDRIHSNIYLGEDGCPTFHQLIFEDWNPRLKCWEVRSWILNNEVWDKTDEEHRKQYIKDVEEFCRLNRLFNSRKYITKYKGRFSPGHKYPYYNYKTGYYTLTMYDDRYQSKKEIITVRAKLFAHSISFKDPERENKKIIREDRRRDIFEKPKYRKEVSVLVK